VDLKHLSAEPSDDEREAIDALLGASEERGPHALAGTTGLREAKSRRHLLLPALHAAQARAGWVSPGALGYICRRLHVPPAEGYGVASFYALFALEERPPVVLHACDDIACRIRGGEKLCADLEGALGPAGRASHGATWLRSPCLGLCEQAPAAMLQVAGRARHERSFGHATLEGCTSALRERHVADPPPTVLPQAGDESLRLLRRVGSVDPWSLDAYRANGGYQALRRALELGPSGVIREVLDSRLVGRGGAAFPTGRKWEAVAKAPVRPHYLACNADESEPGTFKDRVLMEDDPFAVVEAMTVAGFAISAEKGFLYVRGEYPLAIDRLQNAIDAARSKGLLGDDIMGRGARFDIEIRRGAGAYICGEETALFNSLEGFRGEPRNKPPFPVEVGLFGKPTCINNVETIVSVLEVLVQGAAAYAAVGTQGSTGTKLFCISGHVQRPGIFEVPYGTTLRKLLDLAGGVAGGRKLQAILMGGAAGTYLGPDDLDLPLTFEDARKAGTTLGSGVVLVLDDSVDLWDQLARLAAFFRDESCGQCVPCRVGTVRVEELVARLRRGKPHASVGHELHVMKELGQCMRDASICGLGQTASSAIESALQKFPRLVGGA